MLKEQLFGANILIMPPGKNKFSIRFGPVNNKKYTRSFILCPFDIDIDKKNIQIQQTKNSLCKELIEKKYSNNPDDTKGEEHSIHFFILPVTYNT